MTATDAKLGDLEREYHFMTSVRRNLTYWSVVIIERTNKVGTKRACHKENPLEQGPWLLVQLCTYKFHTLPIRSMVSVAPIC